MSTAYNVEHLARAMWTDAEETFRHGETLNGRDYSSVPWERAHELDREEYMARAERVGRLCTEQAQELLKDPVPHWPDPTMPGGEA